MIHRPAATDTALTRGLASEQLVADYLHARGLSVLGRNLRCRAGELDLVCREGDVLVIVEVRQRCGTAFGGALASVTRSKQCKIIRATQFFLQRNARWRTCRLRFDVLAVEGIPPDKYQIVWIKDAFRAR